MITLRIYRTLGEVVTEATALVCHDALGNVVAPESFFLGRSYTDACSSFGPDELSDAVYRLFKWNEQSIAEQFGGAHGLLQ